MKYLQSIVSLKGYKKYLLSVLLGVLATASLPPFFIFPLLIISLSGLFLQLEFSENRKDAFITGWSFGFGHFVSGLYWISYSLLVDPERFAWLVPFAVSLLPALFAIYIGVFSILMHLIKTTIVRKVVLFACFWVIFEFLRAHLFTGFPWNLIGYSWADYISIIQIASFVGIYGLSLLAVVVSLVPVTLLKIGSGKVSYKGGWFPAISIVSITGVIYLLGTYIYESGKMYEGEDEINLRLVQPNITQTLKWDPKESMNSFIKQVYLTSTKPKGPDPDVTIWPEAAIAFFLEEEPRMKEIMANAIPKGSYLIFGGLRREVSEFRHEIWNSVQVLDSNGNLVSNYDKHHLVPFGEFVPLRSLFPFVNKITHGDTDFSRGDGPKTVSVGNIPPFSPLVCYEVIFPGNVADRDYQPKWLLNVTNDGWFGKSTGPHQHFHMARIRAVEEGVPIVRVANTGISGIIDEYGNILTKLDIDETGVIDFALKLKKSDNRNLIYKNYGAKIIFVFIGVLIVTFWRFNLNNNL